MCRRMQWKRGNQQSNNWKLSVGLVVAFCIPFSSRVFYDPAFACLVSGCCGRSACLFCLSVYPQPCMNRGLLFAVVLSWLLLLLLGEWLPMRAVIPKAVKEMSIIVLCWPIVVNIEKIK